jgi:hypothetical protein
MEQSMESGTDDVSEPSATPTLYFHHVENHKKLEEGKTVDCF